MEHPIRKARPEDRPFIEEIASLTTCLALKDGLLSWDETDLFGEIVGQMELGYRNLRELGKRYGFNLEEIFARSSFPLLLGHVIVAGNLPASAHRMAFWSSPWLVSS